jgi:midasin (ATPase involved in ribosome maturation)
MLLRSIEKIKYGCFFFFSFIFYYFRRRVKPDKRKYQILLAIDDSESMKECDAGLLALESLGMICRSFVFVC